MGKGSGGCIARSSLVLNLGDSDNQQEVPGRSVRAQNTFKLLQEAGSFSSETLLWDITKRQYVSAKDADAQPMAHNAFMRWLPSSYHGHQGYIPHHEPLRNEMMNAILLDGDRRANHVYFYRDPANNAVWTLGSAAATRGWYRLPHDGQGNISPQGLQHAVQEGAFNRTGSFLQSLRRGPINTLAYCVDIYEPGVGIELQTRLSTLSSESQKAVMDGYRLAKGVPDEPLYNLRIRMALDLADDAKLDDAGRERLVRAASHLEAWGVQAESPRRDPEVASLLAEVRPVESIDGFHMMDPHSTEGRLLADVAKGWMASSLCDWGIEQWRRAHSHDDSADRLDEIRENIARSPWASKEGKVRYEKKAKMQETRLRSLTALCRGCQKIPPAPKGWKKLSLT
jgi:hypothetical protein